MSSFDIEKLEALFSSRDSCEITPSFVCSNQEDEEAIEETRDFFGKEWKEITPDIYERNIAAISFLTPEAFAYFLPSLIRCSRLSYDKVSVTVDKVLSNLDGRFLGDLKSWQKNYWQSFTDSQIELILQWFDWLSTRERDVDFMKQLRIARISLREKVWLSW